MNGAIRLLAGTILVLCEIEASAEALSAPSSGSSLTPYGIVDLGMVRESGGAAGPLTKISSGAGSTSRYGLRGVEDLGGGLSAILTLEGGFKADTGEQDLAGSIFQRQALVGLKSTQFGAVTFGRQLTPYYTTFATVADPFATSYAGTARNLFPVVGNSTRTSNTLMYATPDLQGINAELAYSLGEQVGSNIAGRQISYAIAYLRGPLHVRLGSLYRNNDVAATSAGVPAVNRPSGKNTLLAANYDFRTIRWFLAYEIDKGFNIGILPNANNPFGGIAPVPSQDARDMLVGFTLPIGAGTIIASHVRKDDRTFRNQDAQQYGIAYSYQLSKRTNLYTSYAKITNRNGAGYTVGNNAEVGSGNRAFDVGVRHAF